MAEQTPNYNLTKPDIYEFYDVEVQNNNMDIIDAALKNSEQQLAEHLEDITWHEAILMNGWQGNFKYGLDKHNNLHIRISINEGVTEHGTNIATLPEGYRPETYYAIVCDTKTTVDKSNVVTIGVNSDGRVAIYGIANNYIDGASCINKGYNYGTNKHRAWDFYE
ncbi:hypothetical protein C3943_17845 [Lysinibacillus sp. B2A1]|nr:hypothetical protein C3943_17845 [Lysinibacillus sp. B2A1]